MAPILLNAVALFAGGSGVQTYTHELVAALPDAAPAQPFAAMIDAEAAGLLPSQIAPRVVRADSGWRRKLLGIRSVRDAALVHGLDVDVPWSSTVPRVATVHDLSLFDTPWATSKLGGVVKRRLTARACKSAEAVIAVSTFTAERIAQRFGRDATVVHEAPRARFRPPVPDAIEAVRARLRLPERFVLHLGNLEPRKDVATLAAACDAAGVPLVLAGGAIRTVDVPRGATALGYVADDDLPALFAAATVVGYVSRYEGFGLPPIEALACGAVVMATRVGALAEVAPEGIEFVAIGDIDAQARALRELFHDVARGEALRTKGLVEVSRLSWARAARETVDVYRKFVTVPAAPSPSA